jgi:hypothetical protein
MRDLQPCIDIARTISIIRPLEWAGDCRRVSFTVQNSKRVELKIVYKLSCKRKTPWLKPSRESP